MTDRELLELAAEAAGIKKDISQHNGGGYENTGFDIQGNLITDWHNNKKWNPLEDDGDALRLAVQLANTYENFHSIIWNWTHREIRIFAGGCEGYGDNPFAATRRAIVRAAAEIGKGMK